MITARLKIPESRLVLFNYHGDYADGALIRHSTVTVGIFHNVQKTWLVEITMNHEFTNETNPSEMCY